MFWTAAKLRKWEIAKYLLELGADVDEMFDHMTALMYAADSDNMEMVRYFVEIGADVNAGIDLKARSRREITPPRNVEWATGRTALTYACSWENFEMVKYLVENGANATTFTSLGYGSVYFAGSDTTIINYLIEQGAADERNEYAWHNMNNVETFYPLANPVLFAICWLAILARPEHF